MSDAQHALVILLALGCGLLGGWLGWIGGIAEGRGRESDDQLWREIARSNVAGPGDAEQRAKPDEKGNS